MAYISVDVDIDVEEHLDEVSTETLINELESRKDRPSSAVADSFRDWYVLADLIAEGECRGALQLLKEIAPVEISPNVISLLLDARRVA